MADTPTTSPNPDTIINITENSPKEDVVHELKSISDLIGQVAKAYDKIQVPIGLNLFVSKESLIESGIDKLAKPKDSDALIFHNIGTAALKAIVPHISKDLKQAQNAFLNDAQQAANSNTKEEIKKYCEEAINANAVLKAFIESTFQLDGNGNFILDKAGNCFLRPDAVSNLVDTMNRDSEVWEGIKKTFPDYAARVEESAVLNTISQAHVKPSIDDAIKLLQNFPQDAVRTDAEKDLRADLTPPSSTQANQKGKSR